MTIPLKEPFFPELFLKGSLGRDAECTAPRGSCGKGVLLIAIHESITQTLHSRRWTTVFSLCGKKSSRSSTTQKKRVPLQAQSGKYLEKNAVLFVKKRMIRRGPGGVCAQSAKQQEEAWFCECMR